MVVTLEVVEPLALIGSDDIPDVLFGVDITDFGRRCVGKNLIADGMNQMGFAKADTTEQIKRVI